MDFLFLNIIISFQILFRIMPTAHINSVNPRHAILDMLKSGHDNLHVPRASSRCRLGCRGSSGPRCWRRRRPPAPGRIRTRLYQGNSGGGGTSFLRPKQEFLIPLIAKYHVVRSLVRCLDPDSSYIGEGFLNKSAKLKSIILF